MMSEAKVLFLCTGNSCRSQMAEGFLRQLAGDRFEVFSAGTKPVGVNPDAIAVMKEIGVDISQQSSKGVAGLVGSYFPYVITVCDKAKESCPIFPGVYQRLHWSFEDPASARGTEEERLAVFRRVRDEISRAVAEFGRQAGLKK